ncbi:MAG: YfiR family protein [Burkholderiales bacterium]|nr:YfiR family protein [Burkholderiales bacterium]
MLPEYRLKAAFLYNFALFTEWPAGAGETLPLCLVGADPFGAEADGLEGKAVGARRLTVQRGSGPGALAGCRIVFVAPAAIAELPRIAQSLRGAGVLLVADSPGALRSGAIINMNVERQRVSFEASLAAAREAGLGLSSRLLRLATEVIQ